MLSRFVSGFLMPVLLVAVNSCSGISAGDLRCDLSENPVGVCADDINFSWSLQGGENEVQQAYRIVVSSSAKNLKNGGYDIWDSGRVEESSHLSVRYGGPELEGNRRYFWKVILWDSRDGTSGWSAPADFVPAIKDWDGAEWIGYEDMPTEDRVVPGIHVQENFDNVKIEKDAVVPCFRKEFGLSAPVHEAFLSICGLGQYEAYINGTKISSFLSPSWADYDRTVPFNTYDVTDLLTEGGNVISAIVGNGFHYINHKRYYKLGIAYGYPKMICKLLVRYEDGREETLVSDESWKTCKSPVIFSSIYGGEDYDARLEQENWDLSGFDDSGWNNAIAVTPPLGKLVADSCTPLGIREEIAAVSVAKTRDGAITYDFGQNASGIIRVSMKGRRGDRIRFCPGELLSEDGRVNQSASGSPYWFEYTFKGDGIESWSPKFTYYGFRYVTVDVFGESENDSADSPEIVDIKLCHTCNTAEKVGSFECSSPLMNRIYNLIDWAVRSNMQSVLSDCPHREKLGWLEQSHLMGNAIRYNYDVYHLYRKMVRDMIDAQRPDGLVPDIAPEFVRFSGGFVDSPEWGSACVIVPWIIYKWYGDMDILREAYPMMCRYVSYLEAKSDGHILNHGLGDWFDYGPDEPGESQLTPKSLTATAIYYHDVKLLSETAGVIGKEKDKIEYGKLAEAVKESFNRTFYDRDRKIYSTGSQTAMSMPLCLGLVPEEDRREVQDNLIQSIADGGYALTAGDVGFHYLVEALGTDMKSSEVLYRMINRSDVPGYGYQIAKGATALTESWPALEIVSNNHLMLGHAMEWFYSSVLGIRDENSSVASDRIVISPKPVGDLQWAEGSYKSAQGPVTVKWKVEGDEMHLSCTVPCGVEARIIAPDGFVQEKETVISGGKHKFTFRREASVEVAGMTCEYMDCPRGLDVERPRFSWKLVPTDSCAYGQKQSAYLIEVSENSDFNQRVVWRSGWVKSDNSQLIAYDGRSLGSDRTYWWRVRVKDENGRESGWSETSRWDTGLFSRKDWTADWIGCSDAYNPEDGDECTIQDPWLRKSVTLVADPSRAIIFVASVGYHELYVNGEKVGDGVLAPVVTDHSVRARYVTYDIAPYLHAGENVIGLWLGASWSIYQPNAVDDRPLAPIVIAQSDIYGPDGKILQRLVTDSTWLTHPSPNRLLGNWSMRNMGGEIWDANLEIPDWNRAGCSLVDWTPAVVFSPSLTLSAQNTWENRKFEEIRPVSITGRKDGAYIVDMGVNFAGWTEINVNGAPGSRIDFEFSEREGVDMTFNNHSAYILGPDGVGTFRNRFNYSSGRWICIKGMKHCPSVSDIRGWTLRTAYPAAAGFECSDELQNWIYDRTIWNFKNLSIGGYVVDCPQRERLGYGGDAHATSETGLFNFQLGSFYTKWMQDWRDAQGRESCKGPRVGGGILPHTAPTNDGGGGPAWGGIVVMLPWQMYQHYGDTRILKENYEMMSAWLDFLDSHTENGILKRFGGEWDFLADWLWPGATAEGMNNDKPQAECFNSCYYALNLATAAKTASVLGMKKDAEKWNSRAGIVRNAVHSKWFDEEDFSYCDRSMGNIAMALAAGVPPENLRAEVFKRLEREIFGNCNGHIGVGITGGAILFMLLREEGRDDLIYSMTSQTDYPGWGYMRENGATSLWEMWEKDLPGHSLLHSSFLFPGAWYIDGVAGIRRDAAHPGFRRFIARIPDLPQLDWAKASYDSPVGRIVSEWKRDDGLLKWKLCVPANSSATVKIPLKDAVSVEENSGYAEYIGIQDGYLIFNVPSGQYLFREKRINSGD